MAQQEIKSVATALRERVLIALLSSHPALAKQYAESTPAEFPNMSWAAKPERGSADEHCKRVNVDKMTPTTPSPISPVKEFEALCDLIPEDAYWGMPLTPDLVRHIRDRSTAPTTGSAPVAWIKTRKSNGETELCGEGPVKHLALFDWQPLYDHPASPAASVPASISDTQILEAFEAAGVQWQSVRTLENDHEYMTRGSQSAKNLIAGVRALLAASTVDKS